LRGTPGLDRLEQAFNRLIQRHEVLRTGIEMRDLEPVQVVHAGAPLEIEYKEIPGDNGEIESVSGFVRPFDLGKPPLLRVRLVRLGDDDYRLLLDLHHVITDGFSNRVIMTELIGLYAGHEPPLSRLQYKDYAHWQSRQKSTGKWLEQEDFWLEIFKGDIPRLELALDFPRPQRPDPRCGVFQFEIPSLHLPRLRLQAEENGCSLFIMLLSIYYILLFRWSGQEDLVVGSAVSGRRHPDFENLVGMFVNVLALRNRVEETETYSEFLKRIRQRTLDAFHNQDYPFDELRAKLSLEARPGRNPLFDVEFNLNTLHHSETGEGKGLSLELCDFPQSTIPFDLGMTVTDEPGVVSIKLEYQQALFKPETMETMAAHYLEILARCLDEPQALIKDIAPVHQGDPGKDGLSHGDVSDFDF